MSHAPGDEIVPGFRLVKFLGRGGIGEVWRATAPGKTFCALKIINLSVKQGRKEYRAVKLVKDIRHSHLVPITSIWLKDREGNLLDDDRTHDPLRDSMSFRAADHTAPAQMILQMGLGDESLHDRLLVCQRKGLPGIPPEELLDYMEEAAKGIDFLNSPRHDLGKGPEAISHGDIKPQNIMLVGGSAQVCDFGLARSLGPDARATSVSASPAYGSPESLTTGKSAPSSDQYSFAISYFELRTGDLPFEDESYFAVLKAHSSGTLKLDALAPHERAVIAKATALDPEKRYESCVKMVRALRRAFEEAGESGPAAKSERPPEAGAPTESMAAAPVAIVPTPPPRAILEPGCDILPHIKLVRRTLRDGADEVWEATSSAGAAMTLYIRDLSLPGEPPDLRALGLMPKLEHPALAKLLSYWLVDERFTPVSVDGSRSLADAAWLVLGQRSIERTLLHRLEECRANGLDGIPPDELLGHMLGVAQALDYLNAARHELVGKKIAVQHGHVRPSHLELQSTGEVRVRLGNFSRVRLLEAESALVPKITGDGAHPYLPPELLEGCLSRWSDQFSLGITYYHLRTGVIPHESTDPLASRIDPKLLPSPESKVLLRATSFDLEQRFETCTDFITQLGAAVGRASRQRLSRTSETPRDTAAEMAGALAVAAPATAPVVAPAPVVVPAEKPAEPKPSEPAATEAPAVAAPAPSPIVITAEIVIETPPAPPVVEAAPAPPRVEAKVEPPAVPPVVEIKPEPKAESQAVAPPEAEKIEPPKAESKVIPPPVEPKTEPKAESEPVPPEAEKTQPPKAVVETPAPTPAPAPAASPPVAATPAPAPEKPKPKPPELAKAPEPEGLSLTSTVDFNDAFRRMLSESGPLPAPIKEKKKEREEEKERKKAARAKLAGFEKPPAVVVPPPPSRPPSIKGEPPIAPPPLPSIPAWLIALECVLPESLMKKVHALSPRGQQFLFLGLLCLGGALIAGALFLFSGPAPTVDR